MATQRHSTVATLRASNNSFHGLAHGAASATDHAAAALTSGPTLGVVPGHRLGRQATLAKGFRLMQPPAALPLFDMSVAVIDSLNLMRASIEEEVVMQSTLGVPAHHALACRLEAYGTPFGAPGLQDVVRGGSLTEDDKQFAACLAAPPDSDAIGVGTPEFSLQRMASLSALQRTPASARGDEGAPATPASAVRARGGGGELLRSPSLQQTEKKKQRAAGMHGGMRQDSIGVDSPAALEEEGDDAYTTPDVTTPRGRAAVAARAAEAARPQGLFAGTGDAVAALVGVGYLILSAARFDRRAPGAVERLSTGLRRMTAQRTASMAQQLTATPEAAGA